MSNASKGGLLPEAQRAFMEKNYDRAEKWCRLHLQSQPEDRDAQTLLGYVLLKTGRIDQAVAALASAGTFEAYAALSSFFFSQGLVGQAVEATELAIRLDPAELSTYNKAGQEFMRLGRPQEAAEYYRRAAERDPTDLTSNQNLAAALQAAGRLEESREAWERVTRIDPAFLQGWTNLGLLEQAWGRHEIALECAKRAIECDPSNAEGYVLAGDIYTYWSQSSEAEKSYRKAVELSPKNALLHMSLGLSIYFQGRFDEAETWLRSSLKLWETNGMAYYLLARGRKLTSEDRPFVDSMEEVLQREDLTVLNRSYVEYGLGKAYEDLKEYETSMRHYDRANTAAFEYWAAGKPWDPSRNWDTFHGIVEMFSPDLMSGLRKRGLGSDIPILIVGMIRSGTTLLEQIVSSHPDVTGAGELAFWEENAGSACNVQERWLDADRLLQCAAGYIDHLKSLSKGAKRVVDKNPHNFAFLGMIQPSLPNAKILHIRRHPVDNCLSIYSTALNNPPEFALKRENMVEGYRQYRALMAHWRATLPPDRLLEIDYEELTGDRERVTRRIIDFLDLEWDDACLEHEKNARPVHTPSAWQVRQPIYKTSVERWRRYEPWLGEFRTLLESPGLS